MAVFFLQVNPGSKFRLTPDGEDWVRLEQSVKRQTACASCRKVLVSAVKASHLQNLEASRHSITDENKVPEYARKIANRQTVYPPTKMRAVVSGFPGVGKSTLCAKSVFYEDLDSSKFSKMRDFPSNYIRKIKAENDSRSIITVSSHQNIIDALFNNKVDFILVYPDRSLKDEYIKRCGDRKDNLVPLDVLEAEWDNWINSCEKQNCKKIVLQSGEYLSDVILKIEEMCA